MNYWILKDRKPVQVNDVLEWGAWFGNIDNRRVAEDEVGSIRVSTVFLGIDHQFGDGPPLLFETMVFGGELEDECERYSTWQAAERGHAAMVARVKASEHWPDVIGAS